MSIEYIFKRNVKVHQIFRKFLTRKFCAKFSRNLPENFVPVLGYWKREHAFWKAPGIYHVNYAVFVFDMFDLQFSMLQSCLYKQI